MRSASTYKGHGKRRSLQGVAAAFSGTHTRWWEEQASSLALSGAPVCGMRRLPEGSRRDASGVSVTKNGKGRGFRHLAQKNRNRLVFRLLTRARFYARAGAFSHMRSASTCTGNGGKGLQISSSGNRKSPGVSPTCKGTFLRRRRFAHAERLHLQGKREELNVPRSY